MHLPHSLPALAIAAACATPAAIAQAPAPKPAPAEIRRVAVVPGVPPEVDVVGGQRAPLVYSNRCGPTAWYPQCGAETFYDSGRLPSTTSVPVVGGQDAYLIEGLELGYVTSELDPSVGGEGVSAVLLFWSQGAPCATPADLGPVTAFLILQGLPGSDAPGSFQTVIADIDLVAAGLTFTLAADGDGVYDHDPALDLFTWSVQFLPTQPGSTGPLFAGDVLQCADGGATAWSGAPGIGTGLGTPDGIHVETQVSPSPCGLIQGCVDFPGSLDSLYLGLRADTGGFEAGPGHPYCFGVGCPCGNENRDGGCSGAEGGAWLRSAGSASVTADDLTLIAGGLTRDSFALMFHGGSAIVPIGFGNGQLCVGAGNGALGLYRYGPPTPTGPAGTFAIDDVIQRSQLFPTEARIQPGDTWYFQVWYRDAGACGSGSSLTNGFAVDFSS